jgi:hypothetical protein
MEIDFASWRGRFLWCRVNGTPLLCLRASSQEQRRGKAYCIQLPSHALRWSAIIFAVATHAIGMPQKNSGGCLLDDFCRYSEALNVDLAWSRIFVPEADIPVEAA